MDIRFVYFLAVLGFVQCKLINLKCDGIKKFVDGHNSRRLRLAQGKVSGQPAASEMNAIIWDDELAEKAAKWASRNKFGHNPDRTISSKKFETGENIFAYSSSNHIEEFDVDMAIETWFDEYKNYHYKTLEPSDFKRPVIGHYTQLVWSDSTYLGCAVSQFSEDDRNKVLVVCNYGPPGNYMGQTPYKRGPGIGCLSCGTNNCSRLHGDSC